MPSDLTNLKVTEVSFCRKGMNQHARVALFKSTDASGITPAGNPGDHVDNGKDSLMSDELKKVADLEKAVADLTTKLAKAEADKAETEALAKMSDKERSYIAGLKDDKAKKEFMAMSADDRAKKVSKAAEDDEVLKVDGAEIRKSVVGDGVFAIMKSQQASITKQAEDLKKANEATLMADLRKRADDIYKHVPGTVDERAAMLKAIGEVKDEGVRKSLEAVFAQSEALAEVAFDTLGHRYDVAPDVQKAAANFTAKAREIQARDKIGYADAMTKARQEDPEGFKAYQGEAA